MNISPNLCLISEHLSTPMLNARDPSHLVMFVDSMKLGIHAGPLFQHVYANQDISNQCFW